jgi:outer membrane receptor protein involved in Fe transport
MIPLNTNQPAMVLGVLRTALAFVLLPALLLAQTAPAPGAAVLAKYDTNKNGVLDPEEIARQQQAEGRPPGDAILLTPFEVSTDKDVGYAAGNTLSGGRVNTPLAITPASISVMTKEFLDDFNITNINDAAEWTIGMELESATPNSTTDTSATYRARFRGAPSDGNFPTRDGNLNFGIADSYNSERFEFSRGPDSTMFGDGGPGGRQGSSSKRARLNNSATTVMGQVDSYGGYRSTLDYNKGWDRFALRLNGLFENNKPYQDDMNRWKKGITIAGTFKVTNKTQITASFEKVAEERNIFGFTIQDSTQFWNNTTVNDNNAALLNNSGTALNAVGLEQVSATNDLFIWNFGVNQLLNYRGNQYRTRGTNFRIPYTGNPYIPPSPQRSFPSGFDRKFTLPGGDQLMDRDSQTLAVTGEHRVGDLFLQLGYTQNMFDIMPRYLAGTPNEARIDVNRLLPNGSPNPKFLKTYADVGQGRNYSQDAVKEVRGIASYRFFKPKFFDYKQLLTLNLGYRFTKNETMSDSWRRVDNPLVTDPFNAQNGLTFRRYWDDPRQNYAPVLTDPNKVMPGQWANVQTAGTKTARTMKYGSLSSQSAFFNEKLAVSASYNKDESEVDNLPRLAGGLAGSTGAPLYKNVLGDGAPGVHRIRSAGKHSTAYGMVVYPFAVRNEGIKRWLSPLGFVVNYSENNQSPGTGNSQPLITGEPAPAGSAKTLDFGLRYAVPGGKAYLTVSRYNTDQENIVGGFQNQTEIRNIWLNLGYTDPALTTNEFNFSDVSSRKLEGWEVELTANPTRNITLTANYSHPKSYIQSERVFNQAYIAQHMAEWQAGAALGNDVLVPNGAGRRTLNTQLVRDALLSIENSLNGLATGTLADNTSNHRINFSGRYGFREGKLRGLNIVGGVNYRGHTKFQSVDPRIKFGLPDNVTPTPQQNAQAAFDYLWVPPYYVFTTGANYTKRFGKYQVRFQLNIANLLDHKDPIWGRNTAGAGNAWNLLTTNQLLNGNPRQQVLSGFWVQEPRKFTFSTTVSF